MAINDRYVVEMRMDGKIPKHSYLSEIPAVRHMQKMGGIKFDNDLTFFVGDNGAGKSTLIEAIAVANKFNPEGGSLSAMYSTNDTHSDLYKYLVPIKRKIPKKGYFLRAESMYNTLSYRAQVFKKEIEEKKMIDYHIFSHGESFLSTINDLKRSGLYILDEPETGLSPEGVLMLMCEIKRLLDVGSQFIISTHSPMLMALPDSCIYQLDSNGISKVDYKETSHYKITKDFLDCPERMIKCLFKE